MKVIELCLFGLFILLYGSGVLNHCVKTKKKVLLAHFPATFRIAFIYLQIRTLVNFYE